MVILQEIFGITEQLKAVARAYARDGYDSIIPAVFDRVKPGTVFAFDQAEPGRVMAYGLALDKVMLDTAAAIARVQSIRGVSILGFCWGGGVIIRAAAELDLRGAIAFYGTRLPTYFDHKPKCSAAVPFRQDRPEFDAGNHRASAQGFPKAESLYVRCRSCLRQ